MDKLLQQINFDNLCLEYLRRIDKIESRHNIEICRKIYNNDSQQILEAIINVDEVRKIKKRRRTKNSTRSPHPALSVI